MIKNHPFFDPKVSRPPQKSQFWGVKSTKYCFPLIPVCILITKPANKNQELISRITELRFKHGKQTGITRSVLFLCFSVLLIYSHYSRIVDVQEFVQTGYLCLFFAFALVFFLNYIFVNSAVFWGFMGFKHPHNFISYFS